jgi:hypothetical protein
MKRLLALLIVFSFQAVQAGGSFQEMTLEFHFQDDFGHYRVWSEGSDYFITQKNSNDAPEPVDSTDPGGDKKLPVKHENLELINSKLQVIKKLKNMENCESRKISVSFVTDGQEQHYQGCLDGKDPMSTQLNQLSATLLILI